MATTTSGSLKGFYRQRKTPNSSSSSSKKPLKSSKKSPNPIHAASYGSDCVQPAALISHGAADLQDDYDENEELLRQFDMNMAYGPCIGMARLARWERACKLGLNPPEEIGNLLRLNDEVQKESLWDGRL